MSRIQHVQEANSIVIERRLRPIYDSLDFGNYKKALQEVEKVLKKSPAIQCARALKALALIRLGKESESEIILRSLLNEKPYDESTLQVMTICYRELNQGENICIAYDNAVKQCPSNEELLSHLFMAYARVSEYKAQQNTALALYKLTPKNPYYFWAVMSVVLQATRGQEKDNPTKRSLLLALSERMVYKIIVEDKIEAEQECQLYLMILELQGKYKEALDFLDGPLSANYITENTVRYRISLMKKLNMWAELLNICEDNLVQNVDDWEMYLDYFASSFKLNNDFDITKINNTGDESNMQNSSKLKQTMQKCLNFLLSLIKAIEKSKTRGPYLARLELYRTVFEHGCVDQELEEQYINLIVEYFRKFGDRGCCVGDLRASIAIIPSGYIETEDSNKSKFNTKYLAKLLIQEVGSDPTVLPENKEQMLKHISLIQLTRLCGGHTILEPEHVDSLFTALTVHYEHGRRNYGQGLLTTDFGPSDRYALIATHLMFDLAKKTKSSGPLTKALTLLNYVLLKSPSNFHVKLLCLQIYHLLGCATGANEIYELLEVKHLQLDSMGYLHCEPLSLCGSPSNVQKLYDVTLNFFTNNYKDSIEHLILSFKFGSFSKLFEFLDFRQRLSGSLHYTAVTINRILFDFIRHSTSQNDINNVVKNMPSVIDDENIEWDISCDNRDFKVITEWEPQENDCEMKNSKESKKSYQQLSFEQNLDCTRLRSQLLKIITVIGEISLESVNERQEKVESLLKARSNFQAMYSEIRNKKHTKLHMCKLSLPMPSRLHWMLELPYEQAFGDMCLYVAWIAGQEIDDIVDPKSWKWPNELASNLAQLIKEQNTCDDPFWNHRYARGVVISTIEILILCTLCCGVCCEIKKVPENKMKKSRKKSAPLINSSANPVSDLVSHLKQTLESVSTSLESWTCPKISQDVTEKLAALSLNDPNLLKSNKFTEDFSIFVKEYQALIKDNIKYLHKMNV